MPQEAAQEKTKKKKERKKESTEENRGNVSKGALGSSPSSVTGNYEAFVKPLYLIGSVGSHLC